MISSAVFPLWLLVSGCLTAKQTGSPCAGCHGLPPPIALGGYSDPTWRGVGAHATHLEPLYSSPVACEECHLVPDTVDAEGHIDTPWPAEVGWDPEGIAVSEGVAEPFDTDTLSCTVYCHGVSLSGGSSTLPVWTEPDSVPCGSCHALPPPPPHPPGDGCADCHSPAAGDPEMHLDGILTVDGGPEGCTDCHGQEGNPAPPPDSAGNTDTSLTSVGAHLTHTDGTGLGAPVACSDCHLVPVTVGDPAHIDVAPAEVIFSGRALTEGASPVWSGTSCSNTYCHGGATPVWTVVDGSQVACGSCHALPPPPPHPVGDNCQGCHGPAGPGPSIDDPAQHIDGSIDL